ncbi:hypothetical protein H2198_006036 [Neophaeococcomyces mojaviensis]|uniref:Uncharacterized protein n=1 Tax=Neophaeococcomyces mojaviensis TaxID=3383035 RepID=A0ACC3A4D9_9EURO|nr:hypothetical protein H2198_006036 [Knufia sp. JES_112]
MPAGDASHEGSNQAFGEEFDQSDDGTLFVQEPGDLKPSRYQPGHSYPAIHISGNSRVHLGDQYVGRPRPDLQRLRQLQVHETQEVEEELSNMLRYKILLRSLVFPQMEARQRNISSAMPQTCDWFFSRNEYLSWLDEAKMKDHHGFFWIKGKPGSGKSTLMKLALERAEHDQPTYKVSSYFFNARATGELEKSPLGLYRTILHRLLLEIPDIRENFGRHFNDKVESNRTVTEWSLNELQEFLTSVAKTPRNLRVVMFVDALDEGDQREVRDMVSFLEDLTRHASHSASNIFRICLSSRHYPSITISKGMSLFLEDQAGHAADIQKYVRNKLNVDASSMAGLCTEIERKSGQIFLWAVLVIPILNTMHDNGGTLDALLTLLSTLPEELHDLFKNVMFRDQTNIAETVMLYQWVLFALRPLSPNELYAAVRFGSITLAHSTAIPDHGVVSRYMLNCSRGLVECTSFNTQSTMQFIHESVRDCLLKNRELVTLQPSLSPNIAGLSHDYIANCCLQQIRGYPAAFTHKLSTLPKREKVIWKRRLWSKYPLLSYAIASIFDHASLAQSMGVSQQDFLKSFSSDTSEILSKWAFIDAANVQIRDHEYYESGISLLYILIDQGSSKGRIERLYSLTDALIQESPQVNTEGGRYGNALQLACARDNERVARSLIRKGANIHAQGGYWENAWIAAIRHMSDSFMTELEGCEASTSQHLLQDTLRYAIRQLQQYKVKLLIRRGCDVNQVLEQEDTSAPRSTPLTEAVRWESAAILDVLLLNGAIIDLPDGDGNTPLALAARLGKTNIMDFLIKKGAEINTSFDCGYGSALHAAICGSDGEAAYSLVKAGADVNIRGLLFGLPCSPLQAVLFLPKGHSWQDKMVQCLLENGADANTEYGPLGPPLQLAYVDKRESLVRLLRKHGANPNLEHRPRLPVESARLAGSIDLAPLSYTNSTSFGPLSSIQEERAEESSSNPSEAKIDSSKSIPSIPQVTEGNEVNETPFMFKFGAISPTMPYRFSGVSDRFTVPVLGTWEGIMKTSPQQSSSFNVATAFATSEEFVVPDSKDRRPSSVATGYKKEQRTPEPETDTDITRHTYQQPTAELITRNNDAAVMSRDNHNESLELGEESVDDHLAFEPLHSLKLARPLNAPKVEMSKTEKPELKSSATAAGSLRALMQSSAVTSNVAQPNQVQYSAVKDGIFWPRIFSSFRR